MGKGQVKGNQSKGQRWLMHMRQGHSAHGAC